MSLTRQHGSWRSEQGETLLELTAAMFVITVGLFGILQIHLQALDNARTLNAHNLAFECVQQELEAWRAAPFDELTAGEHGFRTAAPALTELYGAEGGVTITIPEGAPPDLVEVRMVLRWIDEHGRRIEKELTAHIARKPR